MSHAPIEMHGKIEEGGRRAIAAPCAKGAGARQKDHLLHLQLGGGIEQAMPSGVAIDPATPVSAVPSAGKERARTSARQSTLN